MSSSVAFRAFKGWLLLAAVALGGGAWWYGRVTSAGVGCWLALNAMAVGLLAVYAWRHRHENRPAPGAPLYPSLGAANFLSLLRGLAVALLPGYLCLSGPTDWAPGLLYTFAALADWWDGFLARRSGRVSLLGQRLDQVIDAAGVGWAALLAVVWARLPWWYLAVGLAHYVYRGWLALLRARGITPRPMRPQPQRRVNAGLMMALLAVALWPLFPAAVLQRVSVWFFWPFAACFLRDAGWAAGWDLPRDKLSPRGRALLLAFVRWLAAGGLLWTLHSAPPVIRRFWAGWLSAAALALGLWPRGAALAGLLTLAWAWTAGLPNSTLSLFSTALLTAVAFYGGGAACLWAPDDRLFRSRLGRRNADAGLASRPPREGP